MSTQINSIESFDAYCRQKGCIPLALAEIENDGFYAEVRKGSVKNIKGFTQTGLTKASLVDLAGDPYEIDVAKFEWVRLSNDDVERINDEMIPVIDLVKASDYAGYVKDAKLKQYAAGNETFYSHRDVIALLGKDVMRKLECEYIIYMMVDKKEITELN